LFGLFIGYLDPEEHLQGDSGVFRSEGGTFAWLFWHVYNLREAHLPGHFGKGEDLFQNRV